MPRKRKIQKVGVVNYSKGVENHTNVVKDAQQKKRNDEVTGNWQGIQDYLLKGKGKPFCTHLKIGSSRKSGQKALDKEKRSGNEPRRSAEKHIHVSGAKVRDSLITPTARTWRSRCGRASES